MSQHIFFLFIFYLKKKDDQFVIHRKITLMGHCDKKGVQKHTIKT